MTEVEGVLNSIPLTYVYSDDVTKPLTPSHLLVSYRILTLPDDTVCQDVDDEYTPANQSSTPIPDLDPFLETLETGVPSGA